MSAAQRFAISIELFPADMEKRLPTPLRSTPRMNATLISSPILTGIAPRSLNPAASKDRLQNEGY